MALLLALAFCSAAGAQAPKGRVLTAGELSNIGAWHSDLAAYRSSRDGEKITFTYRCDIQNGTDLQLSEVDLALSFFDHETHKEIFRSEPVRFTLFENRRIPHAGALEANSSLSFNSPLLANFVAPTVKWRTGVSLQVIAVRAIAAPEPGDLHDIGNLIQFMRTHPEKDVLQAFERDPSLVGAKDSKGTTACLVAMADGTPAVVKAIVSKGGDMHAKATTDEDALFYAIGGDKPVNLQFARDQGFTPNRALPGGETVLQRAISQGAEHSVQWLATHGADLNELDSMGFVPLMQAIYWHDTKAFEQLVKAGADPFRRSRSQVTIMHIAAAYDPKFLPRALELGVDIDDKAPPNDTTPLMLAAAEQAHASALWLLDHGANGKAVSKFDWGVLDFAQQSNTLHSDMFFLRDVGDPTKWHAKYPLKKPQSALPNVAPEWKDGLLRFNCAYGSFQSELTYSEPKQGALHDPGYTVNPHLRIPFDLHEWSTAASDTGSHSPAFPNVVFCHSDEAEHVVWKTTVKVTPNTRYVFTCWGYGVADPVKCHSSLILRVNGSASEKSYVPFSRWGKFDYIWLSGNTTSATLEIVSPKEAKDHIFGISDVSLEEL